MRVYEMAKQYGVSSKGLLSLLEELGIMAKSHMTVVSDEDAALIAEHFAKNEAGSPPVVEKSPRYEVERAKPKPKRMTAKEKLAAKRRQKEEEAKLAAAQSSVDPEAPQAEASSPDTADEKVAETVKVPLKRPRVQPLPKKKPVVEEVEGQVAEAKEKEAPAESPPKKVRAPRPDMTEVAKAAARIRAQIHDAGKIRMAAPQPERKRSPKGKKASQTSGASNQPEAKTAREVLESMRKGSDQGSGSKGIDTSAIQRSVRQSLSRIEVGRGRSRPSAPTKKRGSRKVREGKKERAARHRAREEAHYVRKDVLRITEYITVQELAHQLDVNPAEIIAKLMGMGVMATMNQRLEREVIELLSESYEIEIEWLDQYAEDQLESVEEEDEGDALLRPPVVTVMGHVDHGKTSLLDYIRKTNVIAGEAGGITQHIGAYQVETSRGKVTFLDTPGHEAFSAMRARGAQLTDIVVIVVAADDKVMPQTVEAIDHAKVSECPVIIAVNKIDLPAADPMGVKQQLMQHGIVVEEFGGDVQCIEISAKNGTNVEQLLEAISLQAELMELKAVQDGPAHGVVVESQKDPGRGITFTVLIDRGVLHRGDAFVAGLADGRVRALRNENDEDVEMAVPSQPVVVLGANDVPAGGDLLSVVASEREAREIATKRQQLQREQALHATRHVTTLENIFDRIQEGEVHELNLLVKGDAAGSVEALCDAFMNCSTEKVAVSVIHKAVGGITESDVHLAAASNAIIIGFHLHPPVSVLEEAKRQHVSVRTYSVIYEAVDDVKKSMTGLLKPIEREVASGTAEVRETFKVPKIGLIAGCMVADGTIKRNSRVRVIRDQVQIYEGKISSLRRFKEDAKEVSSGFECGIGVEGYQDVRVGDMLQTFEIEEVAQEL